MRKVLLIDNDTVQRTVVAHELRRNGWRVMETSDGNEGLVLARSHRPDVIVSDLLVPSCNGFQICRNLRKEPDRFGSTRIIITSGKQFAADFRTAREAGADHYLVKPFPIVQLLNLMEGAEVHRDNPEAGAAARLARNEKPLEPAWIPDDEVRLRFWGVRGSLPCPGPSTVHYGGNTSCIEIRADGEIIILDAGTGIRPCGLQLTREFPEHKLRITILVSHTHWDHIQGFPFFIPAYNPNHEIRIIGFEASLAGFERVLTSQMESPYFPVSLNEMPGHIEFRQLTDPDQPIRIGPVTVRSMYLNHPGICAGYRVETSGGAISYLPDNEPHQRMRLDAHQSTSELRDYVNREDAKLIEFVRDSEVLIVDAQYNDAEYQLRRGWGHGCVDDAVSIALLSKARHLYLFHHDPDRDDKQLSAMVQWARDQVSVHQDELRVDAAREGLEHILRSERGPRQTSIHTVRKPAP